MISGLLLGITLLLRTDAVQRWLAEYISSEIQESYNIPIEIEKVCINNFKDFSLENIHIRDQHGGTILKADNAMASISPMEFIKGDLQIYTLAFAAPDIHLSRKTPDSPLNIQFIIDELSKDNKEKEKDKKLRINQLIIYDGKFSYDIFSEEHIAGRFDPNHIAISDFGCNLSLKDLNSKNLNLNIRSISGNEKSGLKLNKFKGRIMSTGKSVQLHDMSIELPNTHIISDRIDVAYKIDALDSLAIEGKVIGGHLSVEDVRPFLPDIPADIPKFSFKINGRIDHNVAKGDIYLCDSEKGIVVNAAANILSPYSPERNADIQIKELSIKESTIDRILTLIGKDSLYIAALVGDIRAKGSTAISKDELAANIILESRSGEGKAGLSIKSNGEYSLKAKGKRIELGKIVRNPSLGKCNLNITSRGNIYGDGDYANFKATIESLGFKNYTYAPIHIKGKVGQEYIIADARTNDQNITADISLQYHKKRKEFGKLTAEISSFSPNNLKLTKDFANSIFSFSMNGTGKYSANKDRIIEVSINDLVHENNDIKDKINKFHASESYSPEGRRLYIESDFLEGGITGEYRYSDLAKTFTNIMKEKTPALTSGRRMASSNNYAYEFHIIDTKFISRLFNLPFTINSNSSLSGICNDSKKLFELNAQINNATFKKWEFPTINITGKNNENTLTLDVEALNKTYLRRGTKQESIHETWIILNSLTREGNTKATFSWNSCQNSKEEHGTASLDATFGRDKNNNLTLDARINPTDIMHNGSQWHISAGEIKGSLERLSVKGISIYNDTQRLEISGIVGKNATDCLNILTKNMEVGTLMGLTNFQALRFSGKATGSASLSSLFSAPEISGRFNVDNMKIEGRAVGRGDLNLGWSNNEKAILIDCDIHNDYTEKTKVKGFLSQANDTILLQIDASKLNVNILENKIGAFVTDLDGYADGTFYVLGGWRAVDLKGNLLLNSGLRVKATNTVYNVEGGNISLTTGKISFDSIQLKDKKGNKGLLTGHLGHKNFNNWTCDLTVKADKMIVYDTQGFGREPFYGTVYATGEGKIMFEPKSGFTLEADVKSDPGSFFVYNSSTSSGARDNSFITFTDSSKKKKSQDKEEQSDKNRYKSVNSKLKLDFMLDVTDNLHTKVFTNLHTQDYIDFYGTGTVNAIYDDKTGFSMRGALDLDRGTYKFTIQDIFPKEFAIDKGSRLLFEGDPFNAGLDLTTRLHLPSVPLTDLNTETSRKTTAKVDCVMKIDGTLNKPQLTFDIELPEANEEERDLLASVASTQEQKNTQFIYLLGIGKFYTYDYNKAGTSSESSTAVESLISTTLSSQLNNMLGRIINNDNWDFAGNFSTSERGWNRMEVEGMLRGRLLNNRLLINGNFGYRDNPIANSNFIGDFEIQYLLDKKGIFSTKAYSKTNDRYFTESDLTTQGMGFLVKYDFNRWLFWRKKKQDNKENTPNETENTETTSGDTEPKNDK